MVFDADGREVARHQREHRQILSRPGWVEHDPVEILAHVVEVIAGALRAGCVSITPLHLDMTSYKTLDVLKNWKF